MDFEEFREKLVEDLHEALPERLKGASIEESSVQKLQNRSYDGITVRPEGTNIGVTLDVSKMYEEMDRGTEYESVLAEAVAIVSCISAKNHTPLILTLLLVKIQHKTARKTN